VSIVAGFERGAAQALKRRATVCSSPDKHSHASALAVNAMNAAQRYAEKGEGPGDRHRHHEVLRPRQSRHPDGPDRNHGGGTPQGCPLSPLRANIYLDVLDKELEGRGYTFCRYAGDCNIHVGIESAAETTLDSLQNWIGKHLRLEVNAAKSVTGRLEERRIGVMPESIGRFKTKVREMWRANRSRTSNQLRDEWRRDVQGWWGYFRLAEARRSVFQLEGWIRRHIRTRFWLRWHSAACRELALRRLGLRGRMLTVACSSRGALAAGCHWQRTRRCGHKPLSSTAGCGKTARPVVWDGDRALTPGHSTRSKVGALHWPVNPRPGASLVSRLKPGPHQ
jgi:hypothetical protein